MPSLVNFLITNNLTNKVTARAIFEEKISKEITCTFHVFLYPIPY